MRGGRGGAPLGVAVAGCRELAQPLSRARTHPAGICCVNPIPRLLIGRLVITTAGVRTMNHRPRITRPRALALLGAAPLVASPATAIVGISVHEQN